MILDVERTKPTSQPFVYDLHTEIVNKNMSISMSMSVASLTWEMYVLYNVLWEYKQGHYHNSVPTAI